MARGTQHIHSYAYVGVVWSQGPLVGHSVQRYSTIYEDKHTCTSCLETRYINKRTSIEPCKPVGAPK